MYFCHNSYPQRTPPSPLKGEAEPDPEYWLQISTRTIELADSTSRHLAPATSCISSVRIPDLTYNLSASLTNRIVWIRPELDDVVLERRLVDDSLTRLNWKEIDGEYLVAPVHFAHYVVAFHDVK